MKLFIPQERSPTPPTFGRCQTWAGIGIPGGFFQNYTWSFGGGIWSLNPTILKKFLFSSHLHSSNQEIPQKILAPGHSWALPAPSLFSSQLLEFLALLQVIFFSLQINLSGFKKKKKSNSLWASLCPFIPNSKTKPAAPQFFFLNFYFLRIFSSRGLNPFLLSFKLSFIYDFFFFFFQLFLDYSRTASLKNLEQPEGSKGGALLHK